MDNDTPHLRPDVLGQLLLMQSIMSSLPDEKSIFSFVCRGLVDMPGVEDVYCGNLQPDLKGESYASFPIRIDNSPTKELIVKIADFSLFTPYQEYLKNFCFMLSVLLEERNQRQINEHHKANLRQLVAQRTGELEQEVAERKKAEYALHESEKLFRSTFENAAIGICLTELDGTLRMINPAFANILGYPLKEFQGSKFMDYTYGDDIDLSMKHIQTLLDGSAQTASFEKRYIHRTGRTVNALVGTHLLRSSDGTPQYFITHTQDITAKKLAEDEISRQKRLFETMFNTIPDGVVITDTERVMQLANIGMKGTFGYDQEELLGKSTEILYAKKDKSQHVDVAFVGRKAQKQGGQYISYYRKNNGAQFPGETFEAKLFDEKNRWLGNLEIIRDITKRVQQKKEGEILQKQLSQAQKMEAIGTLAGGIAHDFNNILAAMLGYAEMAKDDSQPGSTISQDLNEVLEAGNRAKSLVRQILAFSRQNDTERMILQPASIVKETITMLRPSLPTTIEITQNISAVTGLIFVDPTQLNQILMNLCTNAFHAMEDTGGILDISLQEVTLSYDDLVHEQDVKGGTFIQLSIGDSGTGIAPGVKDKIFDPYFTTKEASKGTGMGLSMVHGIVKNYGGFISLVSELGEGTIFNVFLPTIEKEAVAENKSNDKVSIGRERILFIDDEEILAQMGKIMLERLGYHVTIRNNSLEALETFQNQPHKFDVVITDQTMPGMTGSDLSRRMLQIRPDIPIILCTGYSTIISEEKAKSMGIKEFAFKPIAKKDIAKLIRKVLDDS